MKRHAIAFGLVLAAFACASAAPPDARDEQKPDPEAVKLFEEARLARAHYKNFPGFAADVTVQIDGKSATGKFVVDADYKLKFEGLDRESEEFARKELVSVVGHRRDTSAQPTPPCVFDTAAGDSPLGKAIRILGDKQDSCYRIRDKQLMVVQRTMPKERFTILALENIKNAEGKYLSASHVVQYWNVETNALVRSDANYHTWTRVGEYDLPLTALKITSIPGAAGSRVGPQAKKITLSNHQLLKVAK